MGDMDAMDTTNASNAINTINPSTAEFFMAEALGQAEQALTTGEFPVGCVLVSGGRVVATGAREGTLASESNETDHAEMVALRRLNRLDPVPDPRGITAFCTLEPCLMCYGALLISGIRRIVYAYEDAMGGGTRCDLSSLPPLYRNTPVSIIPRILRSQSLSLFKRYFTTCENRYLAGSLLATYTLAQPNET
jgi:tRNA(adenine34) deaminase